MLVPEYTAYTYTNATLIIALMNEVLGEKTIYIYLSSLPGRRVNQKYYEHLLGL